MFFIFAFLINKAGGAHGENAGTAKTLVLGCSHAPRLHGRRGHLRGLVLCSGSRSPRGVTRASDPAVPFATMSFRAVLMMLHKSAPGNGESYMLRQNRSRKVLMSVKYSVTRASGSSLVVNMGAHPLSYGPYIPTFPWTRRSVLGLSTLSRKSAWKNCQKGC